LVKNIEAAEMRFLRRIIKISYVDRVTNDDVLQRAGVNPMLMSKINERQLRFLGHIIRKKGGVECSSLQGRVDGKRGRGRPRERFMDRIKKITGLGTTT